MEKMIVPNKARTLFFVRLWALLYCILFVYVAVQGGLRTVGWPLFCMAMYIVVYAMKLSPRVVYLKLTNNGLEYRNYLRSRFIEWKHVDHFMMYRYRGWYGCVGWFYSKQHSGLKIAFAKMMGTEDYFWENFGYKPKDLVKLLEEWRQKHCNEP